VRVYCDKKLHPDIMNDRSGAIDLLNASTWSFASPPVTKLQMPSSLTLAKKRARLHKIAGTTLLIEPLHPIPPGAVRARAWYEKKYGAVAPEPADYFFGVRLEPHGGVNHGQPTAPHRGRLQPGHVRTIHDRPHLHVPQRVAPLHTVAVRDGRIAVRAEA
jgi:hypothetical protein